MKANGYEPMNGHLLLKGTAEVSILEFNDKKFPQLAWKLELIEAGINCEGFRDEQGNVKKGIAILEYGDKIKHVSNGEKFSWGVQYDYMKDNKIKLQHGVKISIEEYFICPMYNVICIIEPKDIDKPFRSIYDFKDTTNGKQELILDVKE